jgi:diamine N-acetyltransferase
VLVALVTALVLLPSHPALGALRDPATALVPLVLFAVAGLLRIERRVRGRPDDEARATAWTRARAVDEADATLALVVAGWVPVALAAALVVLVGPHFSEPDLEVRGGISATISRRVASTTPRRAIGCPHGDEERMPKVELRDIVFQHDRDAVMGLRRAPGQERFLGSMASHFEDAEDEPRALPHPWAVHDAETGELVGFAMISDNIPEPIDEDLVGPYYLWRLLIDAPVQGRGYGAATIDAIVDYLRTRPNAELLYTSCVDGDGSPRGFYLRYGFTDTGRVMWDENVLALDLRGQRPGSAQ